MTNAHRRQSSEISYFVTWVVGVLLGVGLFKLFQVDVVQLKLLKQLLTVASVVFVSLGALMRDQRYTVITWVGMRLISVSLVLLGLLVVSIVESYRKV